MDDQAILKQIKDEYTLGYDYMNPSRTRYRDRLQKWNPQTKKKDKININMIANAIDTLIASFWSNGVKVKFISKQGWIGQEEADNLNSVAEFDKKEVSQQQIEYQAEQDSLFFGVGIVNRVGWDDVRSLNKWRVINPLSWIPDPLPSQTGQFDGQNYRFHGFMMRTTVYDMKSKYDNGVLNQWFAKQSDADEELTREAYRSKNGYGSITCESLEKNFSVDIYNHMTIIDGRKWIFKTDMKFSTIFERVELKPVTREEKLDPMLVPRPIMLNYYDPQRDNPLGGSICDKLEDKQNAKSILFNLDVIKAKKEALGGDFLVNSRLIKNKDELNKPSTDRRNIFIDEEAIGNNPIQNAMYELPQSQIKSDTFTMMDRIEAEANKDSKIDSLQSGLVPDKAMTKAEAQQIQGNANNMISLKNGIKSWFYHEFYFQRWRGYMENFDDGKKKFALLSADFEWRGVDLSKDQFLTKQMPYIMIGSNEDIMAVNEKQKQYINLIYPQIMADQNIPTISKKIFQRLSHRINGLQANTINSFLEYDPSERKAIEYVNMLNIGHMPKTIFSNPNIDLYTLWVYIQKAEDSDNKDKILGVLNTALLELGENGQSLQTQDNSMMNSAANIQMSNGANQTQEVLSRPSGNEQTI